METVVVNINGKLFEIPVKVKDIIDGLFNTLETLRVRLCNELNLDYLEATDNGVLEAIRKLKEKGV